LRVGKAFVSGIALVVLATGAGAIALSRVDPDSIRDFLTEAAREATGREVVVRGATELTLFPSPTLVAENVIFGNAPWSVSPDMARVKRLEARVGFLPLFLGQLRVSRFRLLEPHVLFEEDRKGRRNWIFDVADDGEKDGDGGGEAIGEEREFLTAMQTRVRMVVSEIQIVDGTFSYRNGKATRTVRVPQLTAYGDIAGGSLDLAGRGQFNGRGWRLSGTVGELSALLHNEPYDLAFVLTTLGTKLSGKGGIEHPLDGTGLAVDLALEARSGSELLALAGLDLELPGAVHASAKLQEVDGRLGLHDVEAKARIKGGTLTASGSVDDVAELRGVNLKLGMKAKSLAGVAPLTGVDLPQTGPVSAGARITNPKGRFRLDKIAADIALRGAKVKLSGRITNLARGRGLDLGIDLEAASLARLNRYLGVPLPAVGPVKARARLNRTKHGYRIAKIDARVGRSDARGELLVYPHRKRPRVVGRLDAKVLDLDQILPGSSGSDDRRVFSAEPFSLAWLNTFDGDISVHARKLHIQGMRLDETKSGMSLDKGNLLFTPAGKLGGGKFQAKLSVDARGKRTRIAMRIRGKGIGLGKVSAQIYDTKLVEGARSDVNIDVAGRGNSVRELMAGLSGGIYVATGKATIHNRKLEKVSGDVVTAVLSTVAMQSPEEKTTHMRCGVVRVMVKNGVVNADRTIAMETTRAAMSTSGTVDFRDESLDLGVNLVGRTGPNIGTSSLSGLVRVRGTMAEPEVGADAAGFVGAAATVAGAVATSGLSLIAQGLISQIAADRSTCKTALEIDHGGEARTVALGRAGSRDEAESETGGRNRRRSEPGSTGDDNSGKTVDDGS
jgi:uncharacterized protein involved in outer membrane biogenesis